MAFSVALLAETRGDCAERSTREALVIVVSRVGQALAFTFCPTAQVFAQKVVLIASESWTMFAIMQSQIHEAWGKDAQLVNERRPSLNAIRLLRDISVSKTGSPTAISNLRARITMTSAPPLWSATTRV